MDEIADPPANRRAGLIDRSGWIAVVGGKDFPEPATLEKLAADVALAFFDLPAAWQNAE